MNKTKFLCGLALLLVVMTINIRHAWMNYGIAKDKILAGVVAETDTKDSTASGNKPNTPTVYHNQERDSVKHVTRCIVEEIFNCYKIIDGQKVKVATKTVDYADDSYKVNPRDANINGAIEELISTTYHDFSSMEYFCTGYQENNTCTPKAALSGCDAFITKSL